MDAHRTRRAALGLCLLLPALLLFPSPACGSTYRTSNFVVYAQTARLAEEIGRSAEAWRKQLAVEWLGAEMPEWSEPCPIRTKVSPRLGAGGATSFLFDQGEVYGWEMNVQGSRERVLDSVLPHEITHTIFASHFRRPLPRWADEGACTTVEHRSEVAMQERMLIRFLKTGKGIPFDRMFAMTEYPADVMPLYSQGHSLTQYLIERRGKAAFLQFLTDGMQDDNWPRAVRAHYGNDGLLGLQMAWLDWVKEGRPRLQLESAPAAVIAGNAAPRRDEQVRLASATVGSQPASDITPIAPAAGGGSVYTRLNRATPRTESRRQSAEGASVYDSRSRDLIYR